jgi:pheromone shutdown protein TraB
VNVYPVHSYWVVAAIVGVLSAARITRLIVADDFPPSVWARVKWDTWTKDGSWSKLVHCPFCMAPYVSAIILGWALLFDLHFWWWLFNGWMAGSYVASMVAFHDEGRSD